ncbi:MAG: V-type ATP synthase subunit E family protein [Candidatus Bathyarchaeia archaeon]
MLKRSRDEAEKIISEAKKKAEEIINSAEKKAEDILAKSIKPEIAVMRKRILGAAQLEGRKMILKAKDEAISKVFNIVEEKLKEIASGKNKEHKYEDILFKLIKEAASKIEEKELIITSNEQTLTYLSNNLKEIEDKLKSELGFEVKLKIENNPCNCIGGVIVYNKDKTKIFYNLIEGRLLKLKETLRGKIGEILFS